MSTTKKTAVEVKGPEVHDNSVSAATAFVYLLDPPMETAFGTTEYVRVSAASVMFSGPETYIFASDADGEVTDWAELDGSYRGGLDHEEALRVAGYKVVSS